MTTNLLSIILFGLATIAICGAQTIVTSKFLIAVMSSNYSLASA